MDRHEYGEQLVRDVAVWRRDGVITETQERAILARVGAGETRVVGALRLGWLVTAVSIVGAIVLGAGVVLLLAANWEAMPDSFRTLMVLGAILLAYGVAYVLMYRFDMQRVGSAFLLLGTMLYQAGLFLLAQIYNMPVDSPILFLLGALGAFPLAYLFSSRVIGVLAIADLTTWVIWSQSDRFGDGTEAEVWPVAVCVLGVALYGVGRLHAMRSAIAHLGDVFAFSGIIVTIAVAYMLTFDEVWDEILHANSEVYSAPAGIYVGIAAGAALVAAQLALLPRTRELLIAAVGQVSMLAVVGVVATWPEWTGYAVVFNAVYFAIAGALVVRGYAFADERYINFGLAAVAIGLLTRYCDVFWSLLANSAFFMAGGVLLLVVAFALERVRRELLRGIDQDGAPPLAPPAAGATA